MLESFSAKLIEALGGIPSVTPSFNQLAGEGALFSHIYATDSRTDKGMAAVISGFPVTESIPLLSYPEKNANLPFLSSDLADQGYQTSFTYGGDIDFANMRAYLVNGRFAVINSEDVYSTDRKKGKWGLHDEVMFRNFYDEVTAATEPYFKMLLTISNHEPFEVPGTPKFGVVQPGDKFLSTAFYADSCLGDFIDRLKGTSAWDNLLVILVADHGARLPDFSEAYEPRKFHIPVLWLGGAVKRDTIVTKYGTQADLAVTLLKQMGMTTDHYILGKDMLSPDSESFAFYSYVNGFGMLTDTSSFGLDFITGKFTFREGEVSEAVTEQAKSIQQYIYQKYLDL
jgi:phosphoglycerol transferase MdoB-like AlkP superfamily enzyme